MFPADEIKFAQELIQSFQRARKNLRIYPVNNPVYSKTIEDNFRKLEEYLDQFGALELKIKQTEIFIGEKPVYGHPEKEDNLAFLFFRDGVRELSFKRGLTQEEARDFFQSISYDFDRGDDEDVVTLLWEKDFEHIKYVVDETVLLEDEDYETDATARAREETTEEEELKKAFEDAFKEDTVQKVPQIVQVTNADLNELVREIERDGEDKLPRLAGIFFDLLFETGPEHYSEITGFMEEALEYSVSLGDLRSAVYLMEMVKRTSEDAMVPESIKLELRKVFSHAASPSIINRIGDHLDAGLFTGEGVFDDFVKYLDKEAIAAFITILGELKTIEARQAVIGALTFLGQKDLNALARALSDPRWYVVRNIIYIFRKIGDKRAVNFLTRTAHHSDIRVRMEVLRALGELGGQGIIQTLKEALDDPEASIRTTTVRALGQIHTDVAKKILLNKVSSREFMDMDFNEKKEYFEILSSWQDPGVTEFLIRTLKTSSFFNRGKLDELRACAAYGLGLMGCRDALAQLHKLRDSKNKLLSEYAYAAIKRIEYGR